MSQAVIHGDTVHLAGQVGEARARVDRRRAPAGSDWARIRSGSVRLADNGDCAAMNAVGDARIGPAHPPARARGKARPAAPPTGWRASWSPRAADAAAAGRSPSRPQAGGLAAAVPAGSPPRPNRRPPC
jgi:enamine deaminase RidA (YjgF/YER057c/UK114 family)